MRGGLAVSATTDDPPPSGAAGRGRRLALPNNAYRALLVVVAAVFVGLVVWFVVSFIIQARPAFSTLGFSWIFGKVWDPGHHHYGLLPFILGTIYTTAIALVLAVPVGLGTAIALAYLVPRRVRPVLSTTVELLAAVPSVVYGLWGLIVLAPLFRDYLEPFLTSAFGWTGLFDGPNQGVGLLLAGIILSIMILPTMVAISRDVLAVVPNEQQEGALALGATRWQVLRKVVVPGGRTGLLGAFALATGRALGETVAVALVIGNSPFIAHSLKAPAATLPSLIVNNFGEATGTELSVLFAAGLVLLVIGVAVNALARALVGSTGSSRGHSMAPTAAVA
jgi:phosphate transport system permease protein